MSNDHLAAKGFQGSDVYDAEGERIGTIEEVYVDPDTDRPTWAMVHTGWFGAKRTFLPLSTSTVAEDGQVRVPWLRKRVRSAPEVQAEEVLTHADERRLLSHYDLSPPLESAARQRRQAGQSVAAAPPRSATSDESVA